MTPEQRAEKHVKICIDAWLGSGSVAWDNLLMDHFVQIQKEVLESRRGGKGAEEVS